MFCPFIDNMLTPILFSGTFKLTLQFIEEYPNKPPTVRFVSRMFHPNSKLFLIHIYMSVQEISGSDFVFADLFFPPRDLFNSDIIDFFWQLFCVCGYLLDVSDMCCDL